MRIAHPPVPWEGNPQVNKFELASSDGHQMSGGAENESGIMSDVWGGSLGPCTVSNG